MISFYVVPGLRAGLNIPIPVQTAYLRDVALRENLTFQLPNCEAFGYRGSPVFWKLASDPCTELIVLTTIRYLPEPADIQSPSAVAWRSDLAVLAALERVRLPLGEALLSRNKLVLRRVTV
jgi:hypothetical protein